MTDSADLPFLTAELPGIGGRIKERDEHFVVRELPLYEPSGIGEHVYLTIKRTGRNTADLSRDLARLFGLAENAVGTAGRKDRRALVTQTFSIHLPGDPREPEMIAAFVRDRLQLETMQAARHENKLRTGHLRGNEFEILVALEPGPDEPESIDTRTARTRAADIIAELERRGVPNFFGAQRFGRDGENIARGRRVLKGQARPRRQLADLFISAYQSYLFNLWLAERIGRGDFERILKGDIAVRLDSGGLFEVEDATAETARFQKFEIAHTGPLFGRKMKPATGSPGEREARILEQVRMKPSDFRLATGTRRPGRLPCPPIDIETAPKGLWFRFSLPKGAYATTLLREFMKKEI